MFHSDDSMEKGPTAPTPALQSGFEKIDQDLGVLLGCLEELFLSLGLTSLAEELPWKDSVGPAPERLSPAAGQAYSLAFQLLNMVEENTAAEFRRRREAEFGPQQERGLWGNYLEEMRKTGVTEEEIVEALRLIRVEPVLTAHPTEAKRLSVLEQHRAIYQLIEKLNHPGGPAAMERLRREITAVLERLWRTGETHLRRPEVADERRNLLHYLSGVFPVVLGQLDERLEEALRSAGFDAEKILHQAGWPRFRFGTWVGGDRDGHPLVTAEVTAETLRGLRKRGLSVVRRQLQSLEQKLTLASWMQEPPDYLTEAFGSPEGPDSIEPWRWMVGKMIARLPGLDQPHPASYRRPEELIADLNLLRQGLYDVGAGRLGAHDVRPVIRVVEVFGFHLACLDIRQNSHFHNLALGQLMTAAGLPGEEFSHKWDEATRREFLEQELQSPRPFLPPGQEPSGEEAKAVVFCHRVLAQEIRTHGRSGLGALIVSMTTEVSDLLTVYLLAREAGLCHLEKGQLTCELPVVPLFETLADLDRSPAILSEFLEHPITKASQQWQKKVGKINGALEQQVMVGYSDSCKDAGILASQWALHKAQRNLAEIGRKNGVNICFFHGRGGTVSRGAGPTHRFLEALPHNSLGGAIRLTEQGETVAQKYANLETAAYNLELLVAGVAATTLKHSRKAESNPKRKQAGELMERLAGSSQEAYRQLLKTPRFMEFYRQATPIDALELCQIGSRPSRRTGSNRLEDLRAIPWVFSWNQSRFYLPGWYGVGAALSELSNDEWDFLTSLVRDWSFANYAMTNIESSVASSDESLIRLYCTLVEDSSLRESFLERILEERNRTISGLNRIYGSELSRRRPRMAKTLAVRAEALRTLHRQQVQLLKEWRYSLKQHPGGNSDPLLPELTLSINAIASGLRTTG